MAGISYEMLEQPNTYEPGDVYFGDWEIVREIGAGAYGRVYLLDKTDYGITFESALKVIRIPADAYEAQRLASEGMSEEGISQYYEKQLNSAVLEISAMRSLQHPNVVRCDDFRVFRLRDEQRWDVLIRMELLTPLPRFLKSLDRDFTAREVARIGLELAGALAACAKEGLLHRDVKPENVFVEPHRYDEGFTCKLGDFGAARLAQANGSTMSRQGTELYMAPEVIVGSIYDARADIYSLGMVLYQLANGNHPAFYPRTGTLLPEDRERARMRRLRGEALERPLNADEALAAIICKACAHQAEARYAAADELCGALREYLTGGTTVQPPEKPALPEGVRCTMHLDVNNEKGYVRGVTQASGTTVSAAELTAEEYYSPALVVWNQGDEPAVVTVAFTLDGETAAWGETTVKAKDNVAFRTNAKRLRGQAGTHRISWRCNDVEMGEFTWTVKAGEPRVPSLPEGVRCTMHLDVNNEKGYVRGVTQESGISVSASALDDGEFYSPALVVWNDGRAPVSLTPRGSVDGQAVGWQECSVKPGSNLAFRANADWLEKQLGEHTAEWYLDGIPLGEFTWEVFIPSPGRERMNEGTDEPVPGGPAEEDYSFDDSDDSFETPEEDFICKAVNASSVWIMEYTGRDRRVIIPYEMKGKRVTGICPSASRSCTTLETVAFAGKIDRIDSCAFEGCKSLKRVELPRSVKEIGEWAFNGCVALESIGLSDSLIRIGDCAFQNCENLKAVVLPYPVTHIGDCAFRHCTGLRAVAMRDSVVHVGDSAFSECPNLRTVIIPDSVAKVGNLSFPNGQAMTLQIYRGGNPPRRASLLNRDESYIEAYARKHRIRCEKVRRPRQPPWL